MASDPTICTWCPTAGIESDLKKLGMEVLGDWRMKVPRGWRVVKRLDRNGDYSSFDIYDKENKDVARVSKSRDWVGRWQVIKFAPEPLIPTTTPTSCTKFCTSSRHARQCPVFHSQFDGKDDDEEKVQGKKGKKRKVNKPSVRTKRQKVETESESETDEEEREEREAKLIVSTMPIVPKRYSANPMDEPNSQFAICLFSGVLRTIGKIFRPEDHDEPILPFDEPLKEILFPDLHLVKFRQTKSNWAKFEKIRERVIAGYTARAFHREYTTYSDYGKIENQYLVLKFGPKAQSQTLTEPQSDELKLVEVSLSSPPPIDVFPFSGPTTKFRIDTNGTEAGRIGIDGSLPSIFKSYIDDDLAFPSKLKIRDTPTNQHRLAYLNKLLQTHPARAYWRQTNCGGFIVKSVFIVVARKAEEIEQERIEKIARLKHEASVMGTEELASAAQSVGVDVRKALLDLVRNLE
jgi:hypothetical protein